MDSLKPASCAPLDAPSAGVANLLILAFPEPLDGFQSPKDLEAFDLFEVAFFGVLSLQIEQVGSLDGLQVRAFSVVVEKSR